MTIIIGIINDPHILRWGRNKFAWWFGNLRKYLGGVCCRCLLTECRIQNPDTKCKCGNKNDHN